MIVSLLPSLVFLVLGHIRDKLWAMFSSLRTSEELGEGDLGHLLMLAGISEDDLDPLQEVFSLLQGKAEAFFAKAFPLLNTLGSSSTLEEKLREVLSMLGVSDVAVQADILTKVQHVMHHLNVSGTDVAADLQLLKAFLTDEVQELFKSANISSADVLLVVQHVQTFVRELNPLVADVEETVKDLFDAGGMGAFDKFVDFLLSLGVTKADVKLASDAAVGFLKSLSFRDLPAFFADMHGLLVVSGFPHGSVLAAMSSFLEEVKALMTLIFESARDVPSF